MRSGRTNHNAIAPVSLVNDVKFNKVVPHFVKILRLLFSKSRYLCRKNFVKQTSSNRRSKGRKALTLVDPATRSLDSRFKIVGADRGFESQFKFLRL